MKKLLITLLFITTPAFATMQLDAGLFLGSLKLTNKTNGTTQKQNNLTYGFSTSIYYQDHYQLGFDSKVSFTNLPSLKLRLNQTDLNLSDLYMEDFHLSFSLGIPLPQLIDGYNFYLKPAPTLALYSLKDLNNNVKYVYDLLGYSVSLKAINEEKSFYLELTYNNLKSQEVSNVSTINPKESETIFTEENKNLNIQNFILTIGMNIF